MRIGICWVVLRGPYARTLQSNLPLILSFIIIIHLALMLSFIIIIHIVEPSRTQGTKVCKYRSIPGVVTVCSYPTEVTL